MSNKKFLVDSKQQEIIISVLGKFKKKYKGNEKRKIITFDDLYGFVSPEEEKFIVYFLNLDPHDFGFRGSFLGITDVPENLVIIRNQKIKSAQASLDDDESKPGVISPQFIPENIYAAFKKLDLAIKKDLAKSLRIESGYRSPAYQLITLFSFLEHNNFNTKKVFKLVAFPGYSEHGYPPKQALDLMTEEGIPSVDKPLDMVKTPEYKWLLINAKNYGFYLSYPKNNADGITFEPWHWHYEEKLSS
jgi:hypothetical protein